VFVYVHLCLFLLCAGVRVSVLVCVVVTFRVLFHCPFESHVYYSSTKLMSHGAVCGFFRMSCDH
jgi:hypothetical protein